MQNASLVREAPAHMQQDSHSFATTWGPPKSMLLRQWSSGGRSELMKAGPFLRWPCVTLDSAPLSTLRQWLDRAGADSRP